MLSFVFTENFMKRSILGIILIIGFYYICKQHNGYLTILFLIITSGSLVELIYLSKHRKYGYSNPPRNIYTIAFLLYFNSIYNDIIKIFKKLKRFEFLMTLSHYFYLLLMCHFILSFKKRLLKRQLLTITIVHGSSTLTSFVFNSAVKNLLKGKLIIIYPASLVISNDIFAYFVGKSIGKTKLFKLSPNKTVEGFIGGFISTLILSAILYYHRYIEFNMFTCFVIFFASFIAPFGGFLASVIKRNFKKKDFGTLFPGHGGFLDRFDCHFLLIILINKFW